MGLALVGRFLIAVDQHDRNTGLRRHIGNACTHEARADDADLLEPGRLFVNRTARTLVQLLQRHEERADHHARFGRLEDFGEIALFNLEAGVERHQKALINRLQNGECRRIITRCFATQDGGRGRPEVCTGSRINRAARQLEALFIPGLNRLEATLDELLGCFDQLLGRSNLGDKAHSLGALRGEA